MSDIQTILGAHRGLRLKIARALNITPGAVYQWGRIPAERVADVERVTGIPRDQLRPDLFAPASDRAA